MRTSRRLRVSVVAPFGVVGGAERWLLQLLDSTTRLDVDVTLLADGPLRQELNARGVQSVVLPTGRRPADIARAALGVARHLRRLGPEVVLANGVKAAAVAVPASRVAGLRSVWVKHDFFFDGTLARPLGGMADHVIAVSEEVAAAVRRRDVTQIPPPRPPWRPEHRAEARRFWADRGMVEDGRLTAAMAARLEPYKGVDDAITALTRPGAEQWDLVVIGEDAHGSPGEMDRLRGLAADLGMQHRVRFAGQVADAGRWFAGFDAIAVLTRRDELGVGGEGFGLVALEALHCGVPLIASRELSTLWDMAQGGGYPVPPGSPDAVAETLGRLAPAEVRGSIGRTGRALAARHPDAAECADTLARTLAEVAGRPGAGLVAMPPVSVLARAGSDPGGVDGLVESLVGQLRADDECLVLTDPASSRVVDGTGAGTPRDPRVRVVEAAEPAAALDMALALARHEVVLVAEAGCRPLPGWLEALRAPFAETSPPRLVTGVYRVAARGPLERALRIACFPDPDEARRPTPLARLCAVALGRTFDTRRADGLSLASTVEGLQAAAEGAGDGRGFVRALDAEVLWTRRPSLTTSARLCFRHGVATGLARNRLAVGRDLARGGFCAAAPWLALRIGRAGRLLLLAASAASLFPSLVRWRRQRQGFQVALALPLAMSVKDVTEAAGCLAGLARRPKELGATET